MDDLVVGLSAAASCLRVSPQRVAELVRKGRLSVEVPPPGLLVRGNPPRYAFSRSVLDAYKQAAPLRNSYLVK